MENGIQVLLKESRKVDIDNEENQIVPIMSERLKNYKFTKQDKQASKMDLCISNEENKLDYEIPSNIQEILIKNKKHILENIHELDGLFNKYGLIEENKLKKTYHKTKKNDTKKINFDSSRKTRKQKKEKKDILKKFDDNVIFLQGNHKNYINLNKEDIAALKILNERLKNKSKEQRHEKRILAEVIKMLNDAINERETLLHQNNIYSVFNLEKNIKKIRQLTKQFQECYYKYAANERWLKEYEKFEKSKLKKKVSKLENKMQNIMFQNIKNQHDLNDFNFKINKLQTTITMFKSELNNIKNQIIKHDKSKINQDKMTVKDQSITLKITDLQKKLLEFKDNIVHVASKMSFCIKKVATLIFDKITFKIEEQPFEETKAVQHDIDNTSMSKTDNEKLSNSSEALKKLTEKIDNISNSDMTEHYKQFLLPMLHKMQHNEEEINKRKREQIDEQYEQHFKRIHTTLDDLEQDEDKITFKVEEQLFEETKAVQHDIDNTSTSKIDNEKSSNSSEALRTETEMFDDIFDIINSLKSSLDESNTRYYTKETLNKPDNEKSPNSSKASRTKTEMFHDIFDIINDIKSSFKRNIE